MDSSSIKASTLDPATASKSRDDAGLPSPPMDSDGSMREVRTDVFHEPHGVEDGFLTSDRCIQSDARSRKEKMIISFSSLKPSHTAID
jgi:hypothetical protein